MESCLIISNRATEISREFCDVQARTLFFHTLCSDLDYFTVLIPEKPDEDSVNIHVIATVTACVTVVIILGVIIAYKRYVALQIRGDLRGGLGCRLNDFSRMVPEKLPCYTIKTITLGSVMLIFLSLSLSLLLLLVVVVVVVV